MFLFWWLLPALGCVWFGGWGRCLLIGALGLLPALGCLLPLVVVIGVCLLAPWDSCPPCGVRLPPLGGCGLGLVLLFRLFGASACFAVFLFLLGCCGAHLSFGAGSLLVPPARSIFCFSRLGHLKVAGRTCNDAWFVLSELICRSAGGSAFPGCSYCCEPPQPQQRPTTTTTTTTTTTNIQMLWSGWLF